MNKNLKGVLVVAIIVGVGYFYYKKALDPRAIVIKKLDADFGVDSKHGTFVRSADKEYVKSWAKAIRLGAETFMYNGKQYFTKGGNTTKK
jgi:hypothetical protein